jgi:hypothetical protein
MSLNNINLNAQLIVDLYPNSLIELDKKKDTKNTGLRYLGDNQKNITILVKNKEVPFLNDAEFNFLTSILGACKLNIADVAIVNLESNNSNPEELTTDLNSKIVLLFDVTPAEINLPINFPYFQVQQFNKRTYLYAPTFSFIENDKAVKIKLWQALKNIFNL